MIVVRPSVQHSRLITQLYMLHSVDPLSLCNSCSLSQVVGSSHCRLRNLYLFLICVRLDLWFCADTGIRMLG